MLHAPGLCHRGDRLPGMDSRRGRPKRAGLSAGLRAYRRTCRVHEVAHGTNSLHSAFRIFRKAARLLCQRRIQEIRRGPRSEVVQRLIWLDGEALCVTPEFQAMLNRALPDWLM